MISYFFHNHTAEWLSSGVDADIIELNVKAIDGSIAFEYLYGHAVTRLQNGGHTLNSFWMRRYREFEVTDGWWVTGIDPLNDFERSNWGRYKPTNGQKFDKQKGKPAKYLSPAKKESHPIFLDVPRHIWEKVAARYGLKIDFYSCQNFWQWVARVSCVPIYITEGEKKAGALLTAGYAAVSLPGIWMGTRKNPLNNRHQLVKDLAVFDVLGRQINIIFDFETSYKKASTVNKAATTLGYSFKSAKAFIGYLPGPAKGVDDFLVSGGDFESIKFKTLSQIKAEKSWGMSYQPDILLNQQYLTKLPLPKTGLICIKSPKGTGKTTILKPIVNEATNSGQKVLVLSPRIVLGKELCSKIELPYITETRNFYKDDSGKTLKDGRFAGFGLCVDSLHPEGQGKINPKEWEGALIILDEFEQCLWHLLNSNTCQKNRVKILETFRELIEVVLSTGGAVYAMDADLSDISINYLRKLSGFNIKPYIVRNDWKPTTPWQVKVFNNDDPSNKSNDNPSGVLVEACKILDAGGKIWIQTDSQKVKSRWGTINLESYFKSKYPDKKILRNDAETLSDPNHPAFGITGFINETVQEYDIVLNSPSIVSGVSVDVKHFSAVFAIFQGSIPINDCLQSLARIREPIPRFIWVNKKAVSKIANGSLSPKEIIRFREKELTLNVRLLQIADFDLEENTHKSSLQVWAEMVARLNAAAIDFRESLINKLKEEGHAVSFFSDTDDGVVDAIEVVKKANIDSEAVAVVNAADCSESTFEELQKKQAKTKPEQLTERKHLLKKRYGEKQLSENLKKLDESRGWYSQLKLHYYLTYNQAFLRLRDMNSLEGHRERGAGKVCSHDLRLLSGRVALFKKLGFLDFADGREITKHDSQVQELAALCLSIAPDLQALFGVTVTAEIVEKSPIRIIQRFLKLVGLKLKGKQRRQAGTGDREWVYKFGGFASQTEAETPDLRQAIFAEWERRDVAALADYEARVSDNLGVA